MSKTIPELSIADYRQILGDDPAIIDKFRQVMSLASQLASITEGSGIPAYSASKHAQYFDTATSKYYRNTDGGTTWVALN